MGCFGAADIKAKRQVSRHPLEVMKTGEGRMMKYSLGALVAAGVLAGGLATSASAADLGGNCCADLEERIAELEATTARKGNRKVSLTVSGWVAQQVMWWDDGFEQNVYVSDIGSTIESHVKFTGQATISPGWSAGYVLHIETASSDPVLGLDQNTDNAPALYTGQTNDVYVLQSFWFVKSEQLGKVSVGLQSQASDNTAILVDGSGSLLPANWVQFDYGGFFLRDGAGNFVNNANFTPCPAPGCVLNKEFLTISNIFGPSDFNGTTTNSVRYDSPSFGGFSVSASWGEDDFWDVAARYAGEFSGFKLAVAAAYAEANDDAGDFQPLLSVLGDAQHFQIGGYVEHVPTGLFIYSAYSTADLEDAALESDNWYIKAGLRKRWNPLGHTVFFGEYQNAEIDFASGGKFSEVDVWGLGVVQEVDAAAMSFWLTYRNIDADAPALGNVGLDFDYVKFGALINF